MSAQHTPAVTYAALRARMPAGRWSWLIDQIFEQATSAAHCREMMDSYKADREAIEREAFRARAARGGFRHVGNSGRV